MGPCCLSGDKVQLQHIGVVIPSHIYEFGVHPDLCPFGQQKIWEVNQYYYQLLYRTIEYLSLFQLAPQHSRSSRVLAKRVIIAPTSTVHTQFHVGMTARSLNILIQKCDKDD